MWSSPSSRASCWPGSAPTSPWPSLSRGLERTLDQRTQALVDANARLRRLALDLSLLKEAERAQLASELHDSPMQKLALAQLQIGSASRGCDQEAEPGPAGGHRAAARGYRRAAHPPV
jgi:signal transduction histidine kinase